MRALAFGLGAAVALQPIATVAYHPMRYGLVHRPRASGAPLLSAALRAPGADDDDGVQKPARDAGRDAPLAAAPMPRWLLVTMVFLHVFANAMLAQAAPTAMLKALGDNRVRTAYALGRLSSAAALLDIVVSPQLGRLSDTVGRRPLLILPPAIALLCRGTAAVRPSIGVIVALRVLQSTLSSTYMVALRATVADQFRDNADALAERIGLMSAATGVAYFIGMLAGGRLVAAGIQLPYLASAALLGLLVPLVGVVHRETLPLSQRAPFGLRPPAVGFLRLFSSGRALRGLSTVSVLHTISMGMGDTWQVFARELREWGTSQCALFGALSGLGSAFTALFARRSIRRLGARGHTLLATGCVAVTDLALGLGSTGVAFAALLPNWVGRTQGMAVTARITEVGGAMGIGQGALAGDRQNLHALLKVVGPTMCAARRPRPPPLSASPPSPSRRSARTRAPTPQVRLPLRPRRARRLPRAALRLCRGYRRRGRAARAPHAARRVEGEARTADQRREGAKAAAAGPAGATPLAPGQEVAAAEVTPGGAWPARGHGRWYYLRCDACAVVRPQLIPSSGHDSISNIADRIVVTRLVTRGRLVHPRSDSSRRTPVRAVPRRIHHQRHRY